uniref:Uncharacterized protein n=1 Tax=Tetranychus urticae TaxID=32264 RepID=A0A158P4C2_TETUR
MSTLNWHSLKAVKINDLRLTISWSTDGNNRVCCGRVDLRLFVNDFPTSYGVNLKRWELIQLGVFITEVLKGNTPCQKVVDELTIESTTGGIMLLKRKHRLCIQNKDLPTLEMYLCGVIFILSLLRPEEFVACMVAGRAIEDAFIFSTLVKSEIKSIDEAFKEEEIITGNKLPVETVKFLKTNCVKIFDLYMNNFGEMIIPGGPCNRNDFMLRINGEFLKNLRGLYQDYPPLLRSLTLLMKSIAEYK